MCALMATAYKLTPKSTVKKMSRKKAAKCCAASATTARCRAWFTLSQDVDDAKAVAKYENGVLTLDLPKKAGTTSRRLDIH